ncbi:MAG: tRNA (5-methylaminomethyl-2-thiouridine)(34)-methyltransferase MnmD [Bacteroidota bacterium]
MPHAIRRTADGTDTLYHPAYSQTYHSHHGALAEARHVFLEATGVADRLARRTSAAVLEVGFGTGLNALLTAQAALQHGTPLTFVSLEREVLPAATLAALNHGAVLDVQPLADALVAWRASLPAPVPVGRYACDLAPSVALHLLVGDAASAVLPSNAFDAVYLDAFSPDANPGLWTAPFLAGLCASLRPGGRLATYSAKGSVRRTLQAVGFAIEKRPGPPGKREMLVGVKPPG